MGRNGQTVSADPELDALEKERIELYRKLGDLKANVVPVQLRIYEIEARVGAILRGER